MSYARFTKANYDKSLTFAENAKRISAMWRSRSTKKGAGVEMLTLTRGDAMRRRQYLPPQNYDGSGKKKKCRCGTGVDDGATPVMLGSTMSQKDIEMAKAHMSRIPMPRFSWKKGNGLKKHEGRKKKSGSGLREFWMI